MRCAVMAASVWFLRSKPREIWGRAQVAGGLPPNISCMASRVVPEADLARAGERIFQDVMSVAKP